MSKKLSLRQRQLLLCLVDVINQSCQHPRWTGKGRCRLDHMCLSAYEDAFEVLQVYDVVKKDREGYWLDWELLAILEGSKGLMKEAK